MTPDTLLTLVKQTPQTLCLRSWDHFVCRQPVLYVLWQYHSLSILKICWETFVILLLTPWMTGHVGRERSRDNLLHWLWFVSRGSFYRSLDLPLLQVSTTYSVLHHATATLNRQKEEISSVILTLVVTGFSLEDIRPALFMLVYLQVERNLDVVEERLQSGHKTAAELSLNTRISSYLFCRTLGYLGYLSCLSASFLSGMRRGWR